MHGFFVFGRISEMFRGDPAEQGNGSGFGDYVYHTHFSVPRDQIQEFTTRGCACVLGRETFVGPPQQPMVYDVLIRR